MLSKHGLFMPKEFFSQGHERVRECMTLLTYRHTVYAKGFVVILTKVNVCTLDCVQYLSVHGVNNHVVRTLCGGCTCG